MTGPRRLNDLLPLSAGGLALALAGGALAVPAGAATCDPAHFSGAADCTSQVPGGSGGNVRAEQMNANEIFGLTGWAELSRIGSATKTGTQSGNTGSFAELFSVTYTDGGQGGTWTLHSDWTWGEGAFAVGLKGSTFNVVYLLDPEAIEGNWTAADLVGPKRGNGNGNGNGGGNGGPHDLSNLTLFGTGDLVRRDTPQDTPPETPAPIPLPAAGFLLLGGVAALAGLRRRKPA